MRPIKPRSRWLLATQIPRRSVIPVFSLVLIAGSLPAEFGGSRGRVTGTVRFRENMTTGRSSSTPDRVSAAESANEREHRASVIIYLEGDGLPRTHPSRPATIEQREERFVPHVLAIVQGTTVNFPNRDEFIHNAFSLSMAKSFDLGRYSRGDGPSLVFDTPGIVQVFCQIHADMSAYVLVLEHRFFSGVDGNGLFSIEEVPPGEYTLVAWHPRSRPIRQHVTITPNSTRHAEIIIPLNRGWNGQ